jgi:hypothetical protein
MMGCSMPNISVMRVLMGGQVLSAWQVNVGGGRGETVSWLA